MQKEKAQGLIKRMNNNMVEMNEMLRSISPPVFQKRDSESKKKRVKIDPSELINQLECFQNKCNVHNRIFKNLKTPKIPKI